MRKVPVLVLSLAAVTLLVGMPVSAATLFGNDLPGYKLKPGEAGNNVFDLNDFFDSASAATISYTASGSGSVSGSVGSVFGDSQPKVLTATWKAEAGGESITTNSVVKVTNFFIGGGPVFDDNNRIVGMDGGAAFVNGIVPGQKLSSVGKLVGMLAAGGSAVTPGGVSGGATLVATVGQVAVQTLDTGLLKRTSALLQAGDGKGKATGSLGITATLLADGTYSIATTKADFTAPAIVTFGSKAGSSVDGVSFLAAPATDLVLDLANFTQLPTGAPVVAAANGALTISCKAGESVLLFANAATKVTGAYATISMDYQIDSTDGNVAVAAFDGAVGTEVSYFNPGQGMLAKNVTKNVSLTIKPNSTAGVIPALQVYGKSAVNATISRLSVVQAGPLANYAMNPNAKVDLKVDGSLASIAGWSKDILAQGGAAPVANAANNNFASAAGAGSMYLAGIGGAGLSNAFVQTALSKGTASAECYVKRDGDAGANSAFVIIATDGTSPFASFVAGANVPTDKWLKVVASATLGADAPLILFAVQAAGLNVYVDDISLRIVKESDRFFDPVLLGM